MAIKRFEDIIAWQKAQDLAVDIYSAFNALKDFNFKDQICSAVVSISNNIAEGFDRSSRIDFCRFLYFSSGSCSEVRSMLYLAERFHYISISQRDVFISKSEEISKILH